MRFTPRVSLLVALVLGTLAAFLVRGLVQGSADADGAVGRTIVVARASIPAGLPLTAASLREVPWRSADPLEGSFGSVADLVRDGRRLTLVTLQRGEPVLSTKITAPNQRASLSTQIEEGMRAVTVRVDEVRGVAGFVLPGDRVDVVLTRGEGSGQDVSAFADMLLQNAKVLAIDQIANEGQDKPTVARAVTLELTAQEAQKVVLAQGIGRLSLVLRRTDAVADGGAASRVTAGDLGEGGASARDRVADLEKRLDDMRRGADEAARQAAQRLSDAEARLRGELARPTSLAPMVAPSPPTPSAPRSVVNVIRNGSKTEQYSVLTER